ncbi:TIGR01620 family protein [Xanthobacter autotrophicus]|jgi:putative membrane protein|uniref:TIGR01620 family protein n=1 Tax=Xanthobacter autotrophicus TaxID=280 RepID=A0A6C1KRM2_XANAU|nr:TIGR01620 family protein [Xanthobacter autotrophicus]TLX42706.1 TIGR01620 family protein [Xanthobacter autotrophicus]
MSDDRTPPRRPQVFRLDEAAITMAPREPVEPDFSLPVPAAKPSRGWGLSLAGLFWSALGGVLSLMAYVGLSQLIGDLFSRAEWLGYVGLAFTAALLVAAIAIVAREVAGMARLTKLDTIRASAEKALAEDDRTLAEAVVRDVLRLSAETPSLARARADLEGHLSGIIDGADLVRLSERTLLAGLDSRARQMVSDAARNVSVVTAVSPRAVVDLAFVLYSAVTLMRRLAQLYGGRPGTLGTLKLVKHVLGHLAITGGMAAGDTLVQQIVGQGLAARLSARLGEGVVNGLLTARLGLAAIAVTRPLPFTALPAPRLADVAGGLLRKAEEEEAAASRRQ